MKNMSCKMLSKLVIVSFIALIGFCQGTAVESKLETYIVFLEKPEGNAFHNDKYLESWYRSFLPVDILSSNQERMVHAYHHVVIGFAAKLTAEEAKAMETKEGFLSARPERVLPLHTTHTPSFLGLHQNSGFWNLSNYGKGVIIGLLDTGITPDHPSFSDEGMPPPPAKWKGKCELDSCNNKIIGARNFASAVSSSDPPVDNVGHGTHTSSTAAGSPVPGANFYGEVNGTAVGIAPLAHLAMYKVCDMSCTESAIMAGLDAAIEDGVDVISMSLGGPSRPFYEEVIAIGSYRASQKGIFVSCSAGNAGPQSSSLSNEAPWILTVGAGTVDRAVRATLVLGNKVELDGQSLYQPNDFPSEMLPLVFPGANGSSMAAICEAGSLVGIDIKGKIVLCQVGFGGAADKLAQGREVKENGGVGMILMNDASSGYLTSADYDVLPASHVSYKSGLAIQAYIKSTSSPVASIAFKGTVTGLKEAPQVAYFSSRGPSLQSPGILKPDIMAPGFNILAAWPTSVDNSTESKATFNIISGTSMSCPHIGGTAALLKSLHPDWSPAAIKSAIVTTANLLDLGGKPISDQQFLPASVFDIGAGHVNPSRANDPGLIYDLQADDYIPYLCGLNYTDKEVGLIVQRAMNCSNVTTIPEAQLNYPSFSIKLGSTPQTYTRTVTNIGMAASSYTCQIVKPNGVDIKVTPGTLTFNDTNQKATYTVTLSKNMKSNGTFAQGYLNWMSIGHTVRSPIAVMFV